MSLESLVHDSDTVLEVCVLQDGALLAEGLDGEIPARAVLKIREEKGH